MTIKGYIEHLSDRQVRGWAYRTDNPEEHLTIEALTDAAVISLTKASLYRADLKQAGVGNGDHAFILNFPTALDDYELATVKVCASGADAPRVNLGFLEKTDAAAPATEPASALFAVDVLAQQRPVFILGAARSGTSAMAQSLLKTGFYEGYEEGHIFDLAGRLIDIVRTHYENNGEETERNTLIAQIPLRILDEGIKDQFRAIARFCFRGDRWLDKTPRREMVRSAPLLREIWPEARFVFMKRRAIENIVSRRRKFPDGSFADHCHDWSKTMRAWRAVRDQLGASAIEVEQLEVARDPAGAAQRMAGFLDLPMDVAARLKELLSSEQPERTADRFAATVDLNGVPWSSVEKAQFETICTIEMGIFGYGIGTGYYANEPAHP